jgi:RND family efflux transporter MFP subunit
VEVARAAAAIAEWNLDQQTLRAPIDGVVLDRPTSLGTRVAVNDAIMRIADVRPESLVMRAAVDEEDIARVQIDQPVRMSLYAFGGDVLSGQVTRIYDQADPDRRTFEVEVRLNAPDARLAPGMTGELAFILAEKPRALVIPSQALQGDAVYLVRNGTLVRSTPAIGITSVERAEVTAGLDPGERVVITPIGNLQEGQAVRTSYLDPATAAGLNKVEIEEQPFKAFD